MNRRIVFSTSGRHRALRLSRATLAAASIALAVPAPAFEIETRTDLKARWDNTVKYSAAWRLRHPSSTLLANINGDDGNRNFDRGLISNRVDLLSELDLTYRDMGLRVSGAAWYDALYNRPNNNESAATANTFSVPHREFSEATRKLHGRQAEILDAFVFGSGHVHDMRASFRAGRHTLLWGESLLLTTNSIAYAQAPLDIIKAQSVPASQAKELFMPVGQVSGQVQPGKALSFAAYYQYEWRKARLPGAGSYFSATDLLDAGGESLLLGSRPGGGARFRGADLNARDSGQWGLSARYRSETLDTEFGLYYLRFNDKLPQVYQRPAAGEYALVYPENISLIGASFSTTAGDANVAGEIHMRRNTPLASRPLSVTAANPAPDNRDHPLYAVGNTVHAQVSVIYPLAPAPWWESATLSAEVGGLYRTGITKNAASLDPTKDRSAWGLSLRFTPAYTQVAPNLDMTVPISLSYNPRGKSPVAGVFSGDRAGTFSIGLNTEYSKTWNTNLLFTTYIGAKSVQPLADRRFVSLSIQRSF